LLNFFFFFCFVSKREQIFSFLSLSLSPDMKRGNKFFFCFSISFLTKSNFQFVKARFFVIERERDCFFSPILVDRQKRPINQNESIKIDVMLHSFLIFFLFPFNCLSLFLNGYVRLNFIHRFVTILKCFFKIQFRIYFSLYRIMIHQSLI
jgi:hypothetical protein